MRVSDFRMTKRGRIALYVDDEFLLSMHPDVFALSGLVVGSEVDAESLAELTAQADLKKAKEKALSLLSYREYTSHQLKEKLMREVEEETADEAVERMGELGLLDDADYARRYAVELAQRKHFGVLRIRQELRRRGISEELTAETLEALETDPEEGMLTVLAKKYSAAVQDEAVKRRAYGALLRLGYRPGEARRALNTFCANAYFDD